MARRNKSLFNNPNERNHRDHRSKKNRKYIHHGVKNKVLMFKRKKERVIIQELEDEIEE